MNKKNYELLGVSENATKEEVKAAYEQLRAKYLEERFMDGEVGNNAAKMLTKIEAAYSEIMVEMSEKVAGDSGEGESLARVEQYLRDGNLQEAQRVLDSFNERNGYWHYLQSVVFYRKNWMSESKKQLEIAIQLEPENMKYKEAYRKLTEKIDANMNAGAQGGPYTGQTMSTPPSDSQMGGNACAQCLECCYTYVCLNCLCNMCCSCR